MAQPPAYNRGYDFTSFQTNNPDEALPANQLESEFDAIKSTIDVILQNLELLQRDDTKLANQIVTPESMSEESLILAKASTFNIRSGWAATTEYAVNDIVSYNAATYLCVTNHTASAAFNTDSNYWVLLANAAIDTTSSAVDQFVGTGSQTTFTTQYSYNSNTDVLVFVDGQLQTPVDDYSISGTTVTFTNPPAAPVISGRENVIVWGPSVSTIAAKLSAEASASAALASEQAALQHEQDADTHRQNAATSESNANTYSGDALSYRNDAQDHRDDAQKLAINAEDSQFTLADGTTTGYSALHHKEKALDAQQASESARNTAQGHAADALSHSNTASGHAADALSYSNTAQGHANTAQTQAGLAAASATSASGYADTAEDEKDLAVLARQAAESARDATLTAYDNFDDRYLGVKTSDPTTDNDGNSLIAGSLYFNSTTSAMMVYSGSAWVAAYADGATLVAKSGDTMSGNLTVNANINANSLNVDGSITADGMTIDGGDVTVNGQYSDNAFMVDYSNGRVGVNLGAGNTPGTTLHVKGGQRWETTTGGNVLDLQHYSSYSFIYRSNGALRLSGQGAASTNYLELNNSGGFTFAGNTVYHTGNLDSILDLGITDGTNGQALKTDGAGNFSFGDVATSTAWADVTNKPTTIAGFGITDSPTATSDLTNDSGFITSADGGNAATLDGIDSTSFLRSDQSDTLTGTLTVNFGSNQIYLGSDGAIELTRAAGGAYIDFKDSTSEDYDARIQLSGTDLNLNGSKIWTAGNDGSGSGLDADTLDGVQGSSYLRSDASDTTTGYFSVDNHFRVINNGVSGQGDNNTHFNYQDTGVNYIRGTATYFDAGIDIVSSNIVCDANKGFSNSGAWTRNTTPSGYIELGPANTSYGHIYTDRNAFYFNRTIYSTGNIVAYASDERLKENIKTIEGGLDKVCQLRGVTFDWRDDCEEKGFTPDMKTETGFIAQEVRNVLPEGVIAAPFDVDGSEGEGVSVSGEDYLTVNSQKIIPLLVEAIKELKAEIEKLKKG